MVGRRVGGKGGGTVALAQLAGEGDAHRARTPRLLVPPRNFTLQPAPAPKLCGSARLRGGLETLLVCRDSTPKDRRLKAFQKEFQSSTFCFEGGLVFKAASWVLRFPAKNLEEPSIFSCQRESFNIHCLSFVTLSSKD